MPNNQNPGRGRRRPAQKSASEEAIKDKIRNLTSNPLSDEPSERQKPKQTEKTNKQQPDRQNKQPRRQDKPQSANPDEPENTQKPNDGKSGAGRNRRGGGRSENTPKKAAEKAAALAASMPAPKPVPEPAGAKKEQPRLRIIPLGGIGEIGKNLTVVECGNDLILVDCGLGFPDDDMPGVDIVIPDFSYLEANRDKIRGLVLTHGHEDHIGAVPYLLRTFNIPVYGTRLTLKIIENKLKEVRLPWEANLRCVEAGDTVKLGCFSVEFIRVNHSIADACCLAIQTPFGMIIHSGDFKLDLTPIEGDIMNIPRLGELGNRGVLLLMCESTNAERPGYTPSERTVGKSLEYIFTTHPDKRLIISTFSSNVHRVQQVIDASARHGRKVVITGRSMINIITSAIELGYMNLPKDVFVDVEDMKRYRPEELTVVCTGSQGEPMSALYRMAYGDRTQITLDRNDVVVISASAIPGNEKLVGKIVNELCLRGVGVINDSSVGVHVSGHACQEELKLMQALTKPKFFMPIHGEFRHMQANRLLAQEMGMDDGHIFVSRLGQVLELDRRSARFTGTVKSGNVLVDGSGVGEIGEIVLRDRRLLSQDGLVVVFATIDAAEKLIITRPDVISRGFVYMRESEELIEQVRSLASDLLNSELKRRDGVDRMHLKTRLRDELSRFIFTKTKRRPMILPVITSL